MSQNENARMYTLQDNDGKWMDDKYRFRQGREHIRIYRSFTAAERMANRQASYRWVKSPIRVMDENYNILYETE